MTDQNLKANGYKNEAADKFGSDATADPFAKPYAEQIAGDAEEQRRQSDNDQRKRKISDSSIARKGESYADGQGINAGGDGQNELRSKPNRVESLCFFGQKRVANHAAAQKSQQAEGYPMVVGFDVVAESGRAQPAQQRHERLEKAEQERHAENRGPQPTTQHNAADDRHREAVHG